MAEERKQQPQLGGFDAKWDACLDLGIRRVAYSSLAGALGGLLLFRKYKQPFFFILILSSLLGTLFSSFVD